MSSTLSSIICQVKLGDLEADLVEINANGEKLQRSYNELEEFKLVLQKVYLFLFSVLIFWYGLLLCT